MIDLDLLRDCYTSTASRIVMLVVDGLGGLAHPDTGLSELEQAKIPNLDALARESACGLTTPVLPGVTREAVLATCPCSGTIHSSI